VSLGLQKADAFREDFTMQALWYVRQAGDEVARRFQKAVDSTLSLLCEQPGIGRIRRFRHPKLQGLRSFPLKRPFHRLLIFYRANKLTLQAVRLMHGARDLPRRLAELPGSGTV
jgi:plasmid stabilization system protein ParE